MQVTVVWILHPDAPTEMLGAEMPQTNAFLCSEFGFKGKCRYSGPPLTIHPVTEILSLWTTSFWNHGIYDPIAGMEIHLISHFLFISSGATPQGRHGLWPVFQD